MRALELATLLALLLTAVSSPAAAADPKPPPALGSVSFSVSSRTFGAPLFGGSSVSYRLFGTRFRKGGTSVTAFADGGFPNATGSAGVEVDQYRFREGIARLNAGDFSVQRLEPEGSYLSFGDSFALTGLAARWSRERQSWGFFLGQSKYQVAIRERESIRPKLFGGEYLLRLDRNHLGAGLTLITDPIYTDPRKVQDFDYVFRGTYVRTVSPLASAFADVYAARKGRPGFRAGTNLKFQNGQVTSSLYSFDQEMPSVTSFLPGQKGIQLSSFYKPSELSNLQAQIYYVTDDAFDGERSNLRGHVSYGRSFGSNAPYLLFGYSRDELTENAQTIERSTVADRLSVSLNRSFLGEFLTLSLEHLMNAGDGTPDRSQFLGIFEGVTEEGSFLDLSLVAQREGSGSVGLTTEGSIEKAWRGSYQYLLGAGIAVIGGRFQTRGEGVARIGLTRRSIGSPVYGRVELRFPFSIGLPDSGLHGGALAVDVGTRYELKDLRNIGSILAPVFSPRSFGTVEGLVTLEKKGVGGLQIRINGQPRAVTRGDGTFSTRVPVGPAAVEIDVERLEQGYSVVGESAQEVVVLPRETVKVTFAIAKFSTLQGSLVLCSEARVLGISGARIALISPTTVFTLETTSVGAFQAADIPPDSYDLVIDPASLKGGVPPEEIPKIKLDLTRDVLGYVIRLRCGEPPPEPTVIPPPAPPENETPPPGGGVPESGVRGQGSGVRGQEPSICHPERSEGSPAI